MKAIKIDAENQTITEITLDEKNTLEGMQEVVGGYIERGHELENGDDVFVNEEGLLMSPKHFFYIQGAHQPFAGNAVIVSHDEEGETVAAKSTIEELKKMVEFLDVREVIRRFQ